MSGFWYATRIRDIGSTPIVALCPMVGITLSDIPANWKYIGIRIYTNYAITQTVRTQGIVTWTISAYGTFRSMHVALYNLNALPWRVELSHYIIFSLLRPKSAIETYYDLEGYPKLLYGEVFERPMYISIYRCTCFTLSNKGVITHSLARGYGFCWDGEDDASMCRCQMKPIVPAGV